MKFSALIVVVEDKHEEEVIKVAKEAGAGSVTILHGRNLGLKEKKIFFGLTLEENVSVLLFVLPARVSIKVLRAIRSSCDLDNLANNSLAFTLPLSHVVGLDIEELHKFKDDISHLL
ncbi:MAG TPA: transcriptional regulator [Epsilonproteobacteria bacterium]|nr:transcriptional regulator [Campylobacterota bacterium]